MKYIIIGNGFDLNLGLKTSYRDFMGSTNFRSLTARGNALAIRLEDQARTASYRWGRWVDIEKKLSDYSGATSSDFQKQGETLEKNFDELKKCLIDYLAVAQDKEFKDGSVAYKMMQEHFHDAHRIYNFNYTNAALKVINDLPSFDPLQDNEKHVFVHGSIKNSDIILGVQDSARNLHGNGIHDFLKKSNNPNFGTTNLFQALNTDSDIVFFGHSLGATDQVYFRNYFTQLCEQHDRCERRPTLMFYCYGKDGLKELNSRLEKYTDNRLGELKLYNNVEPKDSSGCNFLK